MHARITNGETTLTLQLRSSTDVKIGAEQSVQIVMHADWEVAGVVILGIIVFVLLLAGAARMIFSRRRAKRAEAAAADDADDQDAAPRKDDNA
jgi:flagellar biosynthesis/type III secretory pathway M-ring protein FliF/YscJ